MAGSKGKYIFIGFLVFVSAIIGNAVSREYWWIAPLVIVVIVLAFSLGKNGLNLWKEKKDFKRTHTKVLTTYEAEQEIMKWLKRKGYKKKFLPASQGGLDMQPYKVTRESGDIPFYKIKMKLQRIIDGSDEVVRDVFVNLVTRDVATFDPELGEEEISKRVNDWAGPERYVETITRPAKEIEVKSKVPIKKVTEAS